MLWTISDGILIASDRTGPRCRVCVSRVCPFQISSIKIDQGHKLWDSRSVSLLWKKWTALLQSEYWIGDLVLQILQIYCKIYVCMFSDIVVPLETAVGFWSSFMHNQNISTNVANFGVLWVFNLQHNLKKRKIYRPICLVVKLPFNWNESIWIIWSKNLDQYVWI